MCLIEYFWYNLVFFTTFVFLSWIVRKGENQAKIIQIGGKLIKRWKGVEIQASFINPCKSEPKSIHAFPAEDTMQHQATMQHMHAAACSDACKGMRSSARECEAEGSSNGRDACVGAEVRASSAQGMRKAAAWCGMMRGDAQKAARECSECWHARGDEQASEGEKETIGPKEAARKNSPAQVFFSLNLIFENS